MDVELGNPGLMDRVRAKREIQEAKINLIKMLSECKTEAQLQEVMRIKEEFMASLPREEVVPKRLMTFGGAAVEEAKHEDLLDAIDDTIIDY